MNIKSIVTLSALTLALSGCGSEYTPDEIEISSKGTIVEKGSDSVIDGTFVLEKVTGESLTVEIDDGLPDGDVEMKNEAGGLEAREREAPASRASQPASSPKGNLLQTRVAETRSGLPVSQTRPQLIT